MEINEIIKLVDKKNLLIKELNGILTILEKEKIDRFCDADLRKAVSNHPAIEFGE